MADHQHRSHNKAGGIVQQLFYPAYAEAGSNDAFRMTPAITSARVTSPSCPSEATTAVRDNRSSSRAIFPLKFSRGIKSNGRQAAATAQAHTQSPPMTPQHQDRHHLAVPELAAVARSASQKSQTPSFKQEDTSQRQSSIASASAASLIDNEVSTDGNVSNIAEMLEDETVESMKSMELDHNSEAEEKDKEDDERVSSGDETQMDRKNNPSSVSEEAAFLTTSGKCLKHNVVSSETTSTMSESSGQLSDNICNNSGDEKKDEFEKSSDISSTASEMGTVIGAGTRMAQLDEMIGWMEPRSSRSNAPLPLLEEDDDDSDEIVCTGAERGSRTATNLSSSPTLSNQLDQIDCNAKEDAASKCSKHTAQTSSSTPTRSNSHTNLPEKHVLVEPLSPPQKHSSLTEGAFPGSTREMLAMAQKTQQASEQQVVQEANSPPHPEHHVSLSSSPSSSRRSPQRRSSRSHYWYNDGPHASYTPRTAMTSKSAAATSTPRSGPAPTSASAQSNKRHSFLPPPLRYARACFSFDSWGVDDSHTSPLSSAYHSACPAAAEIETNHRSSSHIRKQPFRHDGGRSIPHSMSWDSVTTPNWAGGSGRRRRHAALLMPPSAQSSSFLPVRQSAFLPQQPSRQYPNLENARTLWSDNRVGGSSIGTLTRNKPHTHKNPNEAVCADLQTSQRVKTERDDAIDILACLVERGVTWNENTSAETADFEMGDHIEIEANEVQVPSVQDGGSDSGESETAGKPEQQEDTCSKNSTQDEQARLKEPVSKRRLLASNVEPDVPDVVEGARILRELSEVYDTDQENGSRHVERMKVLDELLRSHAYALEMKRAASSASAWLHSIGRVNGKGAETPSLGACDPAPEPFQAQNQQAAGEDGETPKLSDRIDLLSIKAMLHTAQMEAKEKSDLSRRLNEELSKCRAEIGRLKSAARAEETLFTSPNRSILDDNEEESDAEGDAENATNGLDRCASPILPDVDDDDHVGQFSNSFTQIGLDGSDSANIAVVEKHALKTALDSANNIIRTMHAELKALKHPDDTSEAPIVAVPDTCDGLDHKLVNVRMLDAENFVTEWHDLTPPLPPPPDHDLRSPIVSAVLDQWTSDRSLHDSLLSWMDAVLSGGDLSSVPPLTVSSLDHQVRDGIAMHILPLLLRRSDIHVDVQTRAHRRTFYDIAVTVTHSSLHLATDENPHLDVSAMGAAFHHVSGDEVSIGSSSAVTQQSGIMSALGGALGGLLSRRKSQAPMPNSPPRDISGPGHSRSHNHQPLDHTVVPELPDDEEQPYQRVVSAPPGKIGLTFVEFRGHAMVSDVAPSSPLSGWVFPSDILIAIDEVPVSGRRVRDIISLLTSRKDRQRALRVISSHAMNEFTLNSSALSDTGQP